MTETKLCRMCDGVHVIGKLDSANNLLHDTLQISMNEVNGGVNIGVVPLLYPFQNEHTGTSIDTKFIVVSMNPPPQMLAMYIQATSGIIPATTLPLMEAI